MANPSPASIAAIIDHTLLRPDATASDIDRLCAEAIEYGFAAVCVNPWWVARATTRLAGQPHTKVASVVGFPLGATPGDVKTFETERVLRDGATEIDVVINIGALKSGDMQTVSSELDDIASRCQSHGSAMKVILETGLLTAPEKELACLAAVRAGATFVKTSTGFGSGGGATVYDVALLRRLVGSTLGVKASGGIRDLRTVLGMIEAGATRIGTSAGPLIVQEARQMEATTDSTEERGGSSG